jgi:hypothetical protein
MKGIIVAGLRDSTRRNSDSHPLHTPEVVPYGPGDGMDTVGQRRRVEHVVADTGVRVGVVGEQRRNIAPPQAVHGMADNCVIHQDIY